MTIQPGRAGTSVEGGGELVGLVRSWRECDRGAFQGRTLHFTDPVGTAIELTCEMPVVDRRMQDYHHRGGCPQRPDHFQIVTMSSALWSFMRLLAFV